MTDLIPAEAEGRCAARFGAFGDADEARREEEDSRYRQIMLISDADRDALASALVQPRSIVVEDDGEADALGDWGAVPVPRSGFYLSLTTGTSFGVQVASLVSDALVGHGVVGGERRSVVELCLQEAVANAIIHGNLGIASTAKDHPDGYRVFSQMVSDRLSDPTLRRRRIDVFARWAGRTLDISVADQGAGFDQSMVRTEVSGSARSGRGFVFMRALAARVECTDGGRCTSLRFDL